MRLTSRLAVFAAITILFGLAAWFEGPIRLKGYPLLPRTALSDQANVATFAIGKDKPELFRNDYFLSDPDHYDYYTPWVVALVRWSGRGAGDYIQPYFWFGAFVSFLRFWGLFLLGTVLLKRKWAGVFLALSSLRFEYDGFSPPDGLRAYVLFNAFLPYLLAAAWYWRKRGWTWPLVLTACGILVHVHPKSAPVWAPALLLSYLSSGLRNFRIKMVWLGSGALLFALFAFGFARQYTTGKNLSEPLSELEYKDYLEARTLRLPQHLLSVSHRALGTFFGNTKKPPSELRGMGRRWFVERAFSQGHIPTLVFGIAAFVVGLWLNETREIAVWVGLLLMGIVIGSIIIPMVVQWIEIKIRMVPFVFELANGMQYLSLLIFLLGLTAVLGLSGAWAERFHNANAFSLNQLPLILLATFTFLWILLFSGRATGNMGREDLSNELRRGIDLREALSYIRERVPEGTVFVGYQGSRYLPWPPDDLGLFIRIYAHRPVAFCWKDGSALMQRNPRAFLEWAERYRKVRQTLSHPWRETNDVVGFCQAAHSWGARLWLAQNQVIEDFKVRGFSPDKLVRYRNPSYALVDLGACA